MHSIFKLIFFTVLKSPPPLKKLTDTGLSFELGACQHLEQELTVHSWNPLTIKWGFYLYPALEDTLHCGKRRMCRIDVSTILLKKAISAVFLLWLFSTVCFHVSSKISPILVIKQTMSASLLSSWREAKDHTFFIDPFFSLTPSLNVFIAQNRCETVLFNYYTEP